MASIFMSYRRDDASGHAGWLRDALAAEFGADEIFRDINTIAPGEDFVRAMTRAISSCSVLLAVIGRQWLTVAAADGTRRLDDPDDHVRREIAEALSRGVRVVPVLVQGAGMPKPDELPDPLKELAKRNAIALDEDDWPTDVQRLAAAIRRELPSRRDLGVRTRPLASPWYSGAGVRYTLAAVGGAVLVALLLVVTRNRTPTAPASNGSAIADTSPGAAEPPAADTGGSNASVPASSTPVTLPRGGEAALGVSVFEVVDARIASARGGSTLRLSMRLTNQGRYDVGFGSQQFRLALNRQVYAPTGFLSDIVPAATSKQGSVTFEIPDGATTATLRISNGGETAEVALDLSGRDGPTPEQDREARRGGSSLASVPVDAQKRVMRFGDVLCEVRSATLRRYVNKLTLTLSMHVHNRGRYDVPFGDSHFRLIVDAAALAPVSGLSTVVSSESTRDEEIVFDVPLDTRQVVIRTRYGEQTAELPLQLPL